MQSTRGVRNTDEQKSSSERGPIKRWSLAVIVEGLINVALDIGLMFVGLNTLHMLEVNAYQPWGENAMRVTVPIVFAIGCFKLAFDLLEYSWNIPHQRHWFLNTAEARSEWDKIISRAQNGFYRNKNHLMSALRRYDHKWMLRRTLTYKQYEKELEAAWSMTQNQEKR